jgi:hypothetical protein
MICSECGAASFSQNDIGFYVCGDCGTLSQVQGARTNLLAQNYTPDANEDRVAVRGRGQIRTRDDSETKSLRRFSFQLTVDPQRCLRAFTVADAVKMFQSVLKLQLSFMVSELKCSSRIHDVGLTLFLAHAETELATQLAGDLASPIRVTPLVSSFSIKWSVAIAVLSSMICCDAITISRLVKCACHPQTPYTETRKLREIPVSSRPSPFRPSTDLLHNRQSSSTESLFHETLLTPQSFLRAYKLEQRCRLLVRRHSLQLPSPCIASITEQTARDLLLPSAL